MLNFLDQQLRHIQSTVHLRFLTGFWMRHWIRKIRSKIPIFFYVSFLITWQSCVKVTRYLQSSICDTWRGFNGLNKSNTSLGHFYEVSVISVTDWRFRLIDTIQETSETRNILSNPAMRQITNFFTTAILQNSLFGICC